MVPVLYLDVRKILPPDVLTDPIASATAHNYNLKNNKIVISPAGNKVLASSTNEHLLIDYFVNWSVDSFIN